jgi:ABC-type transport system involved in multi-copper enzyme maturation permease subunit
LRTTAITAAVIGAAGSVGLMFRVGRHNNSQLLLILFALWILLPFAGFLLAGQISKHWTVLSRVTLYGVMLVVTAASLAFYGYVAFGQSIGKPASVFLVVPAVSCLILAITVVPAVFLSGRPSRRNPGS